MSGRASEFTASNPWLKPGTKLSRRGFSGTDVLEGLTDILRRWPSEPVVTQDDNSRHSKLMMAIAGYPDISIGTRPLDWPLHPESSKALRISLMLDDVPGMHVRTSLRSSILNRDMTFHIGTRSHGYAAEELHRAHSECLVLLFARLRQLDEFDLDDPDYRPAEENLLAILHSYDNNRIVSNKQLSWPVISGKSGISDYREVLEDTSNRAEFLLSPDSTLVTFEYGYIQNWLNEALPEAKAKLKGTRQRLLRGASALIESRLSEIRARMHTLFGVGSVVIDGGGRLTCIVPTTISIHANLEAVEKMLDNLRVAQKDLIELIDKSSTPGTKEFEENSPETLIRMKGQLGIIGSYIRDLEGTIKNSTEEKNKHMKMMSKHEETVRKISEYQNQLVEMRSRDPSLAWSVDKLAHSTFEADMEKSGRPRGKLGIARLVATRTDHDHMVVKTAIELGNLHMDYYGYASENFTDEFKRVSRISSLNFLNTEAAIGGADKRFQNSLSTTWDAQKLTELMMLHTGQKTLLGRFGHFVEQIMAREKPKLSRMRSPSETDKETWCMQISAKLPLSRILSNNLQDLQKLIDSSVVDWSGESVLDYEVFRGLLGGDDRYSCCLCESKDMDYNSIDKMIHEPSSSKEGICAFHRLIYMIGNHQRLIDSTLHPRGETVDPSPREQRAVRTIVKLDANSLGIVFSERATGLEMTESVDRTRRRSFRFNANWWDILSRSVKKVSGGDQIACWIAAGDDVMLAEYMSVSNMERAENLIDKLMNEFSKGLSELNHEVSSEQDDTEFYVSFSAGISHKEKEKGIEEMMLEAEKSLSSAKNHWRLSTNLTDPHMITRRDGTKKLPEGDWPYLPGDIWHGRSLVRVNDPSHDGAKVEEVWERFEREDWDGLWSEELIGEIRDHFSLDEPESQAQKDQLNRILSRHHVLYFVPRFTLVVLPPKPGDCYILRRNLPPVSKSA